MISGETGATAPGCRGTVNATASTIFAFADYCYAFVDADADSIFCVEADSSFQCYITKEHWMNFQC